MEENPLIFNLSQEIEYSIKGDFSKTASIEINGPCFEVFDLVSDLSQDVTRAIFDAQSLRDKFGDNEDSKDKKNIDGEAMKIILMSSKSVKFSSVAETCKKILLKSGTYDGKEKLKETFFKRISYNDFTRLICDYCANFIFPSLFSEGD